METITNTNNIIDTKSQQITEEKQWSTQILSWSALRRQQAKGQRDLNDQWFTG